MCSRWEADEFIELYPEVQSLAFRVEGRAAEPQVVMRFFLIVAQAARGFLRSVDNFLTYRIAWWEPLRKRRKIIILDWGVFLTCTRIWEGPCASLPHLKEATMDARRGVPWPFEVPSKGERL